MLQVAREWESLSVMAAFDMFGSLLCIQLFEINLT